jgi:hypothetical protein
MSYYSHGHIDNCSPSISRLISGPLESRRALAGHWTIRVGGRGLGDWRM